METENRMVVPRGCGLGTMESYCLIDAEFQFWKMKRSGDGWCWWLLNTMNVLNAFEVLVAQSYLTLCDPMNCSLPGSSVHGIFQARILEWAAIFCSRGSSRPSHWSRISCIPCIGRQILYHCATWEAIYRNIPYLYPFISWWTFRLLPYLGNCK